jgi:ATP-dependent Clp protease ATP-binding subunit ClpB
MTSNIGSQLIKELSQDHEAMEREVRKALEGAFRPEFLNRIDEVIIFRALDKSTIVRIVELQFALLQKRLEEKKIKLAITPAAVGLLAEHGYDPVYGARPLKRTIQQEVQNPLALAILEGRFREGDTVKVDVDKKGQLTFAKS